MAGRARHVVPAAIKGLASGAKSGVQKFHAGRATRAAQRAGGKFVPEGAEEVVEEAAKKGLSTGQTALIGAGAGVGGLLLGRDKNRGPNIRVTKL